MEKTKHRECPHCGRYIPLPYPLKDHINMCKNLSKETRDLFKENKEDVKNGKDK